MKNVKDNRSGDYYFYLMLRWNCYEGLPIKVANATEEIAECNSSHFNFPFTLHLPSMPTTLNQNNENRIFVNLINNGHLQI